MPQPNDPDEFWGDLIDNQDQQDEDTVLRSKLADALKSHALTIRTVGPAETAEDRIATSDKLLERAKAVLGEDVWDLSMIEDADVEAIREPSPELAEEISTKRQTMMEERVATQVRIEDENRRAALSDEERKAEFAKLEEEAEYVDRVRAVNEVIEAANAEGTPAIHPLFATPTVVHDHMPEPLKPVVETFHKWTEAQGHERIKMWNELSQLERDLLTATYGVRGPVTADELESLKESE